MARITGSDDLFRLVHSMNKAEQGYFRKFAGRHVSDNNQYLQLFDAITRQKEFEEQILKKQFKAYKVMKVYLFDTIMKSLLQFSEQFEKREELMLQIVYAEILLNRGLRDKALTLLEKGLADARRHELFAQEEEFIRRLIYTKWGYWTPDHDEQNPLFIYDDLEEAVKKIRNEDRYRKEEFKIIVNRKKTIRGIRALSTEKADIDFLKDETAVLSPKAARRRLFALMRHYTFSDDHKQAYDTSLKLFKEELKQKDALNGYISAGYIDTVNHHVVACANLMRLDEAEEVLDKHWGVPSIAKFRIKHFFEFLYFKTYILWRKGEHKEGEKLIQKNLEVIMDPQYRVHFWTRISQILCIKIMFEFSNAEYRKAALTIHQYLSLQKKRGSDEYIKSCEFLEVMIQAELKNFSILQNYIRNMLRKGRQVTFTSYETRFLNTLKELDGRNNQQVFTRLSEMFPIGYTAISPFNIFFMSDWIDGKKRKIPFAQAIKESLERMKQQ